ncbi:cytochrome P450 [Amylostereum chailletii]|nr:cytochrome P450 [Amylostereum chailletii]
MSLLQDITASSVLNGLSAIGALAIVAALLVHAIPWAWDSRNVRAYPGPWLAKFSDVWLGLVAFDGHRSDVVHEMHQKYGTFIRIAPNHISISDPKALEIVYGHGVGTLKSDFYDSSVTIDRSLSTTRDRAAHARKRRIVSHVFAPRTVLEYEPIIHEHATAFVKQWDALCDKIDKGAVDGRMWFNCMPWFAYLAFDVIGDLSFGAPFGMVEGAKDSAPVANSYESTMGTYGKEADVDSSHYRSAVELLRKRGAFTSTIGVFPSYWRPLLKRFIPWFNTGGQAAYELGGIAVASIAKRLVAPSYRADFLTRLLEGKDDSGQPLGPLELSAEAFVLLLGGSDTMSATMTSITYFLALHPRSQKILQKELDNATGSGKEDPVCSFTQIKNLPYLEAVVNETMRIYSTVGIGLPREVPEGGLDVLGRTFLPGTIVSVPLYTVHHDVNIWGPDADAFRPERWLEDGAHERTKYFHPFSLGPRACVGRNLAMMEILIAIATVMRRYDIVLEDPSAKIPRHEATVNAALSCKIGLKRRDANTANA